MQDSCRIVDCMGPTRVGRRASKGENMSIKCGKCQATHESVAQVRACYGSQASQPKVRTNRYAGTCIECGCTVSPESGHLFRSSGVGSQRLGQGEWLVRHMPGDCEEAKLLQGIKGMQPHKAQPAQPANFKAIPQGYYATKSATGNNDLDFWFVRVAESGKWQGWRFVRRVIGGRSPEVVHSSTGIAALHAILDAGTEAAGMLFAQELGRCRKCGRDLTDDTSRQLGIGPVCRAQ